MRFTLRRAGLRRSLLAALAASTAIAVVATANSAQADDGGVSDPPILGIWEAQSLNGVNNNPFSSAAGSAGTRYLRIGSARYADGASQMVSGPNARAVSNRIFNDININVFSERGVTQWGNVWGQFVDHNIGHRDEAGTAADIPFNANDPMESFRNTLGVVPFNRSVPAPGTGVNNARQHLNTENSFLDAEAVYGTSDARLDWLRSGSLDGNPDNNSGSLLLPNNYLPRATQRGNPSAAPVMAVDGRLLATPGKAVVAGDVRANEQALLTSVQTLFAREHNRIVAALPSSVSQQDKFQIARAVVIAEIQYITYNEFLPAMGVSLPAYRGYDPGVDPSTAHEFATVAYRAHSIIHGEMETDTNISRYSQATLDALRKMGAEVEQDGADVTIAVPDNLLFFNPDLVEQIQLGPIMAGITGESGYRNDETIDNQLRSILFRIPTSSNPDCLDGPTLPECFSGVVDLGAIDLQRGRDHGMPSYNQMRNAYGLSSKTSFTAITGESTDAFPRDPLLTPGNEINAPNCLDVIALFDINGNPTTVEADNATRVVRRCTVAARLKALYGSVSNIDAFTGMMAEKHVSGTEMGELQLAAWKDQFGAARDGDRFFYLNDPLQSYIRSNFGIDSRRTLAQVIAANTDIPANQLPANVFRIPGAPNAGAGPVDAVEAAEAVAAQPEPTVAASTSTLTRHDSRTPLPAKQATPPAITGLYPGARQLHRRRSTA
ncbi:peroxidase family protein [Actinocrispum sp. NPDC049592]|uniref:peroxidase family protein n=1 Tax=Actinocrispum sp. NPDC049592 TaxID=3154835 RepID=UPI00343F51D2